MTEEVKKRRYPTKRAPKRIDSKYKPQYARDLKNGKYWKDGKDITKAELCSKWKISYTTWKNWVNNYSDFREAVEIAKMHHDAYWLKNFRDKAVGINPDADSGCLKIRMVNMESEEWTHRPNNVQENNEPITTININILPPAANNKQLTNGTTVEVDAINKQVEYVPSEHQSNSKSS